MSEKIHTTKCGVGMDVPHECVVDASDLEVKQVPHDHGVNTEYFLNGELVRRDCNVDLNLAKQVTP